MEKVVQGIQNVLVYIDDLLLHSGHHPEHLKLLDEVLFRLVHNGIKMNLKKCIFGSPEVTYLGFQLTREGIKPGKDKLKRPSQISNRPQTPGRFASSWASATSSEPTFETLPRSRHPSPSSPEKSVPGKLVHYRTRHTKLSRSYSRPSSLSQS
jgi:hypothetical protein